MENGYWSSPKIVLSVHLPSGTVLIPGKSGKRITVGLEDIIMALPDDSLAKRVQHALDEIDDTINDSITE